MEISYRKFVKSLLNLKLDIFNFRIVDYHEITINSFKFIIMKK